MARSSNRDRIARAALEAHAAALEKAAKRAAKPPKAAKVAKVAGAGKSTRVKIVWQVCSPNGAVVATFAYPDKAAAEIKLGAVQASTGRTHVLRGTKVPMD
ncbi:MAG: hypothetical protein JNL28_07720 [Planctomycetes bacterium]|nr:hypothetical protein [Planctomycetota bacterium]